MGRILLATDTPLRAQDYTRGHNHKKDEP